MSVDCPPQVASKPPTLSIGSRRARLLTSDAARLSPQTCFRLPHCLGCFAACGYTHPPGDAGYGDFVTSAKAALPWLADYRLAPVIVLPVWMLMLLLVVVVFVVETNRSASADVVILVLVLLLYMGNCDKTYMRVSVLYILL